MDAIQKTTAVLSIIIMAACSKETITLPKPEADNTAIYLMAGNWKLTSIHISPGVNGMTDLSAILPECEKDNIFEFKAGGKFYFDQGATKCDPALSQTDEGTWSYDSLTKKLDYASTVLTRYSITVASSSSATVVGFYQEDISGVTNTITGTFTRQ